MSTILVISLLRQGIGEIVTKCSKIDLAMQLILVAVAIISTIIGS